MRSTPHHQSAFTLVEMAIVLVIIGMLLAGLLMPLAAQVEQRRIGETQKSLDEIREALIGFAVANGRLPRPATSATNGAENPAACPTEAACTGFVPWATLGVAKLDAWGKIIRYSVTPAFANSAFTLTTAGTKTIQTRNSVGALITLASTIPAVVFSQGKDNWGTGDTGAAMADTSATNADEDANEAASVTFISREPSDNTATNGGEFDDLVAWISPNILFNRMVSAQKLP